MLVDLRSQLRVAVRSLLRAPILNGAAILCIGLGVGASVVMYSAVRTALLERLPFPESGRLVGVFRTTPHFDTGPFAPGNYLDLRARTTSLEGLAAISTEIGLLRGLEQPLRVSVGRVTGNLFEVLRVAPVHGRLLRSTDEDTGRPPVAVIGTELWRDRFGGQPEVVGRSISLDGIPHEIVGIIPPQFALPRGSAVLRADVWVPHRFTPAQASLRRSNFLSLIGRLRPRATIAAADAELRAAMNRLVEAHPELEGEQLRVVSLHGASVRTVRQPLLLLLGAVGFVLLIAVANVAGLLLARGLARREELAVRAALGAAPRRLIRPALIESALLTIAGGSLGVGLAWLGVRAIRVLLPATLPQLAGLTVDLPVLAFALVIGVVVATTCALAPMWQASATQPADALRSGGRGRTGGRERRWLRLLVSVEVSLSLLLLLGFGLLVKGFQELVSQDPGFDPENLITLTINLDPDRYLEGGTVTPFLEPALDRLRAIPGILQAGAIDLVPYQNWGNNFNIIYEGQSAVEPTRLPLVERRVVTPGVFPTIGQALERGRLPTWDDGPDDDVVAVVNAALVARDLQGEDPIGRRFHLTDSTFATIIGVVRDIKNVGPERSPRPEAYFSYRQSNQTATNLPVLVRTSANPATVARAIRETIRELDPAAAVGTPTPMTDVMARSVGEARFYVALLGIFAGVALLLAVAGLYGVMSFSVALRTREIGIRSALGSSPTRTILSVMGEGVSLVAAGLALGLMLGMPLMRLLGSLLYGVSPLDLSTWVSVPILLASGALLAVLLPARRAVAIDPLIAMRVE